MKLAQSTDSRSNDYDLILVLLNTNKVSLLETDTNNNDYMCTSKS